MEIIRVIGIIIVALSVLGMIGGLFLIAELWQSGTYNYVYIWILGLILNVFVFIGFGLMLYTMPDFLALLRKICDKPIP